MKLNPSDFQPEQKNEYDLSLTKEEKVKLLIYSLIILAGVLLFLGLFKSHEIVAAEKAAYNLTVNASNVSTALLNSK